MLDDRDQPFLKELSEKGNIIIYTKDELLEKYGDWYNGTSTTKLKDKENEFKVIQQNWSYFVPSTIFIRHPVYKKRFHHIHAIRCKESGNYYYYTTKNIVDSKITSKIKREQHNQ